ncbi:MAG: hypothetical protein Q7P63_15430 [Verrucomicrobiota bacterium JB022]|nr:hypothetical protein [Verrucomicrobiota bacterium JB022]
MKLLFILPIIILACLTSCNPHQNPNAVQRGKATQLGATHGYVLAVLTVEEKRPEGMLGITAKTFSAYSLHYRPVGGKHEGTLRFSPGGMYKSKNDFPDGLGHVYLLALPAGEYELYEYGFYEQYYNTSITHRSLEFSMPFEVKPGEVTYIGRFNAKHTYAENMLGTVVLDSGYFIVEDAFEEDLAHAQEIYPEVNLDSARKAKGYQEKIGKPILSPEDLERTTLQAPNQATP